MLGREILRGRTVLVTGAGRNIGRAIAMRSGLEGARVVVNDVDAANAEAVAAGLRAGGAETVAAVGDMSDFATVDALFAQAEAEFGIVDVLVNNAYARVGETVGESFLSVEPRDWELFVGRNLNMLYGCTQRAARALAAAGARGSVINISSIGAERAHRNHIPYDSVKGAMEAFTRAVAVDLAPWGIRVNALRPGAIAIENEPAVWGGKQDLRATQIPMGRMGAPQDVAAAVVFLASADSGYVTGQIFNVDGGMTAQLRAPQVEITSVARPGRGQKATPALLRD